MTVHDKARLLALGLSPNGLMFKEDAGVCYLPFRNVPFELETIVTQWFSVLPTPAQEAFSHDSGGELVGLTLEGWGAFVSWLVGALRFAQQLPDFQASAAAAAQRFDGDIR